MPFKFVLMCFAVSNGKLLYKFMSVTLDQIFYTAISIKVDLDAYSFLWLLSGKGPLYGVIMCSLWYASKPL